MGQQIMNGKLTLEHVWLQFMLLGFARLWTDVKVENSSL